MIRDAVGDVGERRWWDTAQMRSRAERNWDPEIVYEEGEGWPGAESCSGADAIIARFEAYAEAVGELELEIEDIEDLGDDRALLVVHAHGQSVAGVPTDRRWAYVLTFKDSKLVRWRAEIDPERTRRELGLG